MPKWTDWVAKLLRPPMHSNGGGAIQIGAVRGDLTIVNLEVNRLDHEPSRDRCRACPVRCCSHRVLDQDTQWREIR